MSETSPVPERVNLYVLSAEDTLYEGQTLWVQVPLEDGLIGIWPGHAPLIASVSAGRISFDVGEGTQELALQGGILRVDAERCVILVGALPPVQETTDIDTETLASDLVRVLSESQSEDQIQDLQKA